VATADPDDLVREAEEHVLVEYAAEGLLQMLRADGTNGARLFPAVLRRAAELLEAER
jgi:hypothetical protein